MSGGRGPRRPPPGLAGPHAQTIVGSLRLRPRAWRRSIAELRAASAAQLLSLANGVRLLGYHCPGGDPAKGLVVLLHGWEGGAESGYLLSLARALRRRGYATFRLNLRDHGGTYGLNEGLFHSCRIDEVVDAVAWLQRRFAPRRLAVVGYSLGGNFALRVGARAEPAGLALDRIVAVCPVLHPPHTMHALETGLWIYRRYYLARWRRSLRAKEACFPERYRLGDLRRFPTLTATTEFFVREHTGFADIDSYLNGYSLLGDELSELRVPSRIIASVDDPIIPAADLAELPPRRCLDVAVLPWGGHCGFVGSLRLDSCIDAIVVDALAL